MRFVTLSKVSSADALASVVVFLVAVPLAMGIAIASGAPPATGLITAIIGGIVGGALSGSPLQVSGPAAGLAVIVFEFVREYGLEALGPVIVLAGVVQIAAGYLRIGQLFRSIGPAVVYGMLAGIGVLIFAAQFHVMLDEAPRESAIGNLLAIPQAIYRSVVPVEGGVHHWAALAGVTTIVVWMVWNRYSPEKLKWVPGALLGVVAATVFAQVLKLPIQRVELPDNLLGGLEVLPVGSFARLMNGEFLVMALALAFVASAETLLSAIAIDQMRRGERANYDRELISQGVGNFLAGLLGGLPMTGVIVRSAANVSAGAKTRLSAILHGLWILALVALAPGVLRLVPTASLAGVLVYTGYKLVNPQNIRRLLQYGAKPVAIYAVTLIVIVADDLLAGIVCGLLLSLATMLYSMAHLDVKVHQEGGTAEVELDGAATFLRMPMLMDELEKLSAQAEVHLHVRKLTYVDHSCLDAIAAWEQHRNDSGAVTVVEWQELMRSYQRANLFANASTVKPLAGAGH